MEDDLDTVSAILLLREIEKSDEIPDSVKLATFLGAEKWLGLGFNDVSLAATATFSQEILDLAAARETARRNKDFALSDKIRDDLSKLGVLVTDTAEGQVLTQLQ